MPFGCFPLTMHLGWTRSPCILPRCIVPVEETARTAAGEEGCFVSAAPMALWWAHGAGVTAVVVLSGTMGAGEHRTLLRTQTVSPKRRTATTRSQQALMSRGWHCWAGVGAARPARGEVVSASAPVGQRAETIKKGN